jgi:hypothetical protein
MASQNPSTAYGAAPEKPKSFFSSFPSFSLPKLPDFFGTGSTAAPAPAPASAPVAPGPASQSAAGRRRRRGTKKAGRRRRNRRGGLTPAEGVKWKDSDIRYMTEGTKAEFPPVQVRKPTGKGRRTHRVKKHSRR